LKKSCHTCAHFCPQTYAGEVYDIGRCCHLGFFRAGLAKPPEEVGGNIIEPPVNGLRNAEFLKDLHDRGFYFYDLPDIRNPLLCEHWRSPLSIFQEILDFYHDDLDTVVSKLGQEVPYMLLEWMKDPTFEEKKYEKLHHVLTGEYTAQEVPERVLNSYNSCQGCAYFKREIGEDGSINPFRGTCAQMGISSGVWAARGEENPVTYSFLGCNNWKSVNQAEPVMISDYLRVFTETNPILSVEDLKKFYAYSCISRKKRLVEAEHKALLGTDLIALLKSRHAGTRHVLFYTDFDFGFVSQFFGKSLHESSKESEAYWKQFQHYTTAEDDLFGAPPQSGDVLLNPVIELQILEEFGSQFSISTIKEEMGEKVKAEIAALKEGKDVRDAT
jgi:hypothetical protein